MNAIAFQNYLLEINFNCLYSENKGVYTITEKVNYNDLTDEIIDIEEIEYEGEIDVYDLETEDGTFCAGVGTIIVHNTDSVFVTQKNQNDTIDFTNKELLQVKLNNSFKIGEEMAKEATKLFKQPILLEFEKVYMPIILLGKKMYISLMYETPKLSSAKMDKKGIGLKRRDTTILFKKIYLNIINKIFELGPAGVNDIMNYLSSELENISNQNININDVILSKTYKANYKSQNIPHKILVEKMQKRDIGSAPVINDRVPFVFIQTKKLNDKLYEKVEHPDYAKEHNLKLDSEYYITSLKNPITSLLETFVPKELINKLFESYIKKTRLSAQNQSQITKFFKKHV